MTTLRTVAAVAAGLLGLQAIGAETSNLESRKDKLNYSIGVEVARNYKRLGVDIDLDLVIKGLRDGLAGDRLLIPEAELRRVMIEFQAEQKQKLAASRGATAQDYRRKGETFLVENKSKPGVVSLPSGLQYKIVQEGKGRKPADTNTVQIAYRGTRIDGAEFERSKADQPVTFQVGSAPIRGWSEALRLMPAGSKWQLFVPPHLAYGTRGGGNGVLPNETLVYELELVAIK